jgi:hypothetical protein
MLATESSVKIAAPVLVPGEFTWISQVSFAQVPGSVALVLLMNADHVLYEPCAEFGPLCCLGLQLRLHVWGGDIAVLNSLRNVCEGGSSDSWVDVSASLSARTQTSVKFSLKDIRDATRTGYAVNGIRDVRILTLFVQSWAGCDGGINNDCVVRVQGYEQIMRVDTSGVQQISTVSLPVHCTSDKPQNSFWLPLRQATNYSAQVCEWFCDAGFARCPGYGPGLTYGASAEQSTSSSNARCHLLPLSGAELHVSAAFTQFAAADVGAIAGVGASREDVLNALSENVARRFKIAGVFGVEQCAVIVRENTSSLKKAVNKVDTDAVRVDLPLVKGRIRVNDETHYDGIVLREATSADTPNEAIAVELNDVDDRLVPGFTEITVLVYSNNTSFSLATQAVLLRFVLFDSLRLMQGVGAVLFVSDVSGVMNGVVFPDNAISFVHIMLLGAWASVVVFILSVTMLCPWSCTSGTRPLKQPAAGSGKDSVQTVAGNKWAGSSKDSILQVEDALPTAKCCGNHSPRDRVYITAISIFVISTVPATIVLYIFVVLPRVESSNDPFIMLVWIWCTFIVCIAALVVGCCLAANIRTCLVWLRWMGRSQVS